MTLGGYSSSTDTFWFFPFLFPFLSLFVVRLQKLLTTHTTSARPACLPPLPRHSYQEPLFSPQGFGSATSTEPINSGSFLRDRKRRDNSSLFNSVQIASFRQPFVVQPLVFGFYSGNGILPSSAVSPRFSALNSTPPPPNFPFRPIELLALVRKRRTSNLVWCIYITIVLSIPFTSCLPKLPTAIRGPRPRST